MVEVVVVLILLSLSLLTFLYALNTGKTVRVHSEIRTIQGTLLNDLQNQIRSRKFEDPTTGSATFGKELDQGESSIDQFDDIDDFFVFFNCGNRVAEFALPAHFQSGCCKTEVSVTGLD